MITSGGRAIIGKYLLGQSTHYADYLAIGCGYNQLQGLDHSYTKSDRNRSVLLFEMVRSPIISKGIVSEEETVSIEIISASISSNVATLTLDSAPDFLPGDTITVAIDDNNIYDGEHVVTEISGKNVSFALTHADDPSGAVDGTAFYEKTITKLTLKAELPTDQRFKITEVGIFSDKSNALAGQFDSKKIAGFLPSENWVNTVSSSIPEAPNSIINTENEITVFDADPEISIVKACFVTDENAAWDHPTRKEQLQPPRFYDKSILLNGVFSTITWDAQLSQWVTAADSNYIKTNSLPLDMNENNSIDQVKLAFALIPNGADDVDMENLATMPDNVVIVIDLLNDYSDNVSKARWVIDYSASDFVADDNKTYLYQVAQATKGDFAITGDSFSWAAINGIRIYTEVKADVPANWNVLLDGLRLDNVSTLNPLYGLVGYTVLDTNTGQPVLKRNNTSNFIEYRFTVDI